MIAPVLVGSSAVLAAVAVASLATFRRSRLRGRGRGFAIAILVWMVTWSAADLVQLWSHLVDDGDLLRWIAIALQAASVGCAAWLMSLLHKRWLQIVCDSWLVCGALLQLGWMATALILHPPTSGASRLDLTSLALTMLSAAMALPILPKRSATTWQTVLARALRLSMLLRTFAVGVLFVDNLYPSDSKLVYAAVLVLVVQLILVVQSLSGTELRLSSDWAIKAGFERYLPTMLGMGAGVVTLTLLSFGSVDRGPGVYVLLATGALALGTRQALTSREHAGLARELAAREARYRTLVHRSTDVILICSVDTRIEYASPAAHTVLGAEPANLVGRLLSDVLSIAQPTLGAVVASARGKGEPAIVEGALTRLGGGHVHLETLVSADDDRIVCNIRDVTERAHLQARLSELAFDDALTGLPNRARILDILAETVEAAKKNGGSPAVLFIDLDGFKGVNDAGGHAAGDAVLAEVGQRLHREMRDGCFLGRLGGDEFVVLIPDVAHHQPLALAEALVDVVRRPYVVSGAVFVIGASIGVAEYGGTETAEDLLQNADLAVYQAKRGRRGWMQFDRGMHDTAVARASLDAELSEALSEQRMTLHFQPVVDLIDQRIVATEALLRWWGRDGVLRSPEVLLEFAERTGSAADVTRWVLREAIAQHAAWAGEGLTIHTAVNLTPAELRAPTIAESIDGLLTEFGVPPGDLVLEITEQTLLDAGSEAGTNIVRLAERGVQIAVDDFGTGYSSLHYLLDLPISTLKIDRRFTARLHHSERADVIVGEIIRTARRLGMRVIAEGIEASPQRDRMIELGAVLGQGYLFSPPVTPAQLARMAHLQSSGAFRSGSVSAGVDVRPSR